MDITPIVFGMLKPLLWLLPLMVAGVVLKSPWFKGWLGEWKVRDLLRRHLDPEIYREFANVTVRDEFGDTTQIDHVYVSRYGVFVLETKHMGHWIYGTRAQSEWTQNVYGKKFPFQNPLRQNCRHVKVLVSLLGVPEEAFKSVIVFTGDCTFKTEMPDEVRTLSNLVRYIRSIDEQILTAEQVDSICRDLQGSRLAPSWQTHRQHVDGLRRRHGTTPAAATMPSRSRAESFVEAAGERLLRAAEDRIRNDGRRQVSRAVQVGLGAVVAKALFGLATLFLIWWFLTTALGNVVRLLPQPQRQDVAVPAPAPAPSRNPVMQPPIESTPMLVEAPPQPAERHLTARELAEERRQAEETMRILERSTPEIPLALPGSPAVGPAAYPQEGNRTSTEANPGM